MTIQTSNENQRAFSDSEMDERVVWDDFQRADLDDDLETYLVETYDSITYVEDGDEIDESEAEEVYSVEEKAAEAVGEEEEDEDDEDE